MNSIPPPFPSRAKEVSVFGLIEDASGNVLFVKQVTGKRLWTLPGGKVRARESLHDGLHREIQEELGVKVRASTLLEIYDRPEKAFLGILYRVTLQGDTFKPRQGEIERIEFRASLPAQSTPSARFFWKWAHRHNG